jgi:phage protein U
MTIRATGDHASWTDPDSRIKIERVTLWVRVEHHGHNQGQDYVLDAINKCEEFKENVTLIESESDEYGLFLLPGPVKSASYY